MDITQARKILSLYDEILKVAGSDGSILEEFDRLDGKVSAILKDTHVDESLASDTKDRIKEKVLSDTILLLGMTIATSVGSMKNSVSKVVADDAFIQAAFEKFRDDMVKSVH